MRIEKLRDYLFDVLNTLTHNTKQINANMLSNNIDNYSLDKIPTNTEVEKWITGLTIHRDVYSFRSRKAYSQDTINNLNNIGFFEQGILPDIDGIESIECLNSGTMNNADGNTAEFDIQIQITYREIEQAEASL